MNCSISDNLYIIQKYFEKKNIITNIIDYKDINILNIKNNKNIICLQAFELSNINFSIFEEKPSVLWVWEFKSLPNIFKTYEKYFDKIYVPSNFCLDVFKKHLSIPIVKIEIKSLIDSYLDIIPNHTIENKKINEIIEKTKYKIKYGFCFDLNSSIIRKNPLNLVKTFEKLDNKDIALILKFRYIRDDNKFNKLEEGIYNDFLKIVNSCENIYIITDELKILDLYKLYTYFDYYISPHCGEGFGITIYDNMILGNKIISPYYSGETEYLIRNEIIELEYEEKVIEELKEHPGYGLMNDCKAAYISVDSIINAINLSLTDKTIVIMGNGQSLKNIDFNLLKNFHTFGLNSAYKKYKELNFYPTYFGSFDPKLVEYHHSNFVELMNNSKIKKFYFLNENTKGQKQFTNTEENNTKYQTINFHPPTINYTPSSFKKFYKLQNSGATAALISILLGYKKIILLGCDCNYIEQIPESKLIDDKSNTLQITETPKENPNYWFDNYQEKGEIYSVPGGAITQIKGWGLIAQAAKYHKVEIVNCSMDSKIPYFVKINFGMKEYEKCNLFKSDKENKNIITTLTNNKYFEGCMSLITSCQKFNERIVVFYFDLDIKYVNLLKNLIGVTVINFNNKKESSLENKHCQGYFLKTILLLYCYQHIKKNILYIDSTIILKKNINIIFNILDQEKFFFVDHSDRDIEILNYNCFHTDFIKKYNINENILLRKHINSGLFGFNNKDSNTNIILKHFMEDLKDMNITENYTRNKFEKNKLNLPEHIQNISIKDYIGCRQDQSILSYLNGKYNLKFYESYIIKYSIDCGSSEKNYNKENKSFEDNIIKKIFNMNTIYNNTNNKINKYSSDAYTICTRLEYINYNDIQINKILDIICVTLGKRDFKKYLESFIKIDKYELINLIIIDDSGNLETILKNDRYKRINFKYKHVKKSLLDCFIEALELIETNYAMWLNDDDHITNTRFLEIVLKNITEYPDVDIFYGKGLYKDYITGQETKAFTNILLEKDPYNNFSCCYGMLQPSTFFKKDLLQTFKELSYFYIFDINFFVLNINKKFKFINENISETTINNDTITDKNKEKQLISHYHLLLDQNIIIKDQLISNNINGVLNKKSRLVSHIELKPEYNNNLILFIKNYLNYRFTKKKNNISNSCGNIIDNINTNSTELRKYKEIIERSFYLNNNLNQTKILVIGNGPSTKELNFNNLEKNIITIGMNSAYRYWYKIKWFPDIYTNLDPVVAESHYNSIMNLLKIDKIKIFFLHDILLKKNKHLRQNKKIIFLSDLHYKYNIFDNDMLSTGAFSIRLAIFLGFYNIDFIGIDCNYNNYITGSDKLEYSKLIISEDINTNENYFFDNYQQKGDIYQVPDVNKDFHLRCINRIYNDLENLKVKLNIVNLGKNKNKNILFK